VYLVEQLGDVAGQQRNLQSILGRDKRWFSSPNIQTTSQAIIHWAPRNLPPDVKQLGHADDHSPMSLWHAQTQLNILKLPINLKNKQTHKLIAKWHQHTLFSKLNKASSHLHLQAYLNKSKIWVSDLLEYDVTSAGNRLLGNIRNQWPIGWGVIYPSQVRTFPM